MLLPVDRGPHIDSPFGWVVVCAAAIGAGISFGTVYTFGAFFDAMADDLGSGRGSTALVFGITLLLFFGSGIVIAPLADRLGPRWLVAAGTVLLPLGLLLTSRVDTIVAGYVTYGIGVGLGGSLVIGPLFTAASGWIVGRRALALGVLATGNGLGTLLLVPLAERMIDDVGWRDAYAWLALLDLVVIAAVCAVVRRPPVPPAPPAVEWMKRVARTATFRRLFATTLTFSVGLYVAFGFVVDFARESGVDSDGAALLVGIIGASSIIGRLGLTAVSGEIGAVRMLQGCLAVQPIAFLLWLVADGSYPVLVVFAILLGVGYGGFVALGPEVALGYFGVVGLGGVMGLVFLAFGLGGLLGPPLGGVLADATEGPAIPIAFALATSVAAFACSLTMRTGAAEISA
jgi:predicted MFS family arabinose efflux permease